MSPEPLPVVPSIPSQWPVASGHSHRTGLQSLRPQPPTKQSPTPLTGHPSCPFLAGLDVPPHRDILSNMDEHVVNQIKHVCLGELFWHVRHRQRRWRPRRTQDSCRRLSSRRPTARVSRGRSWRRRSIDFTAGLACYWSTVAIALNKRSASSDK
jgi:hypothetical protein